MRSEAIPRWVIRALRAPTVLYDWNLGWLLGRRFLRLTHRGRRSGRCYRTMLEGIGNDRARHEVLVMVGLGRRAQWYRNVIAGGAVELAVGSERFRPEFRELAPAEAVAALDGYEQRNRLLAPIIRAVLSRLVGWHYDGSPAARERLVSERPILAFRPAAVSASGSVGLDRRSVAIPEGSQPIAPLRCGPGRSKEAGFDDFQR